MYSSSCPQLLLLLLLLLTATATAIATNWTAAAADWTSTPIKISLQNYKDNPIYIAFKSRNGNGQNIFIDDININDHTNKSKATKISFVSTELQGVNNINVFDIIALGRFPYTDWFGNLKPEDIETINNSISRVGLESISTKIFSELKVHYHLTMDLLGSD